MPFTRKEHLSNAFNEAVDQMYSNAASDEEKEQVLNLAERCIREMTWTGRYVFDYLPGGCQHPFVEAPDGSCVLPFADQSSETERSQ